MRDDPANDDFLNRLVDKVDPSRICSGIGEQPAMIHMSKFGCVGYTSGCVCVNPKLSTDMLQAIGAKDWDRAENIRTTFVPLENLRNEINPIRVLHDAVELADIAATGPHVPLLSGLTSSARDKISKAALALKAAQD